LPRRAVLVTFDDACVDFLEVAWPLLRQYRVPAVVFVPTAYPGEPGRMFWWDSVWQMLSRTDRKQVVLTNPDRSLPLGSAAERWQAWDIVSPWLKALSPEQRRTALSGLAAQLEVRPEATQTVLSWSQLRHLATSGVTLAPHSQTHEFLDQIAGARLDAEIAGSRDDLVRELGQCAPVFAYPNGNFNATSVDAVRRAGFEAALTTVHGASRLGRTHPLVLRRDDGRRSRFNMALQLMTPVAALRARRHPLPQFATG
jgi:peptidoglycan/xylan/chitin deacetylase (PgdA/CDA1 family)